MRYILGALFIFLILGCEPKSTTIADSAPGWDLTPVKKKNGKVISYASGESFDMAFAKAWENLSPGKEEFYIDKVQFLENDYSIQITRDRINDSSYEYDWYERITVSFFVDSARYYEETFLNYFKVSDHDLYIKFRNSEAFRELSANFGDTQDAVEPIDELEDEEEVTPDTTVTFESSGLIFENIDKDVFKAILADPNSTIGFDSYVEYGEDNIIHHVRLTVQEENIISGNNGVVIPNTWKPYYDYWRPDSKAFEELQKELERLGLDN